MKVDKKSAPSFHAGKREIREASPQQNLDDQTEEQKAGVAQFQDALDEEFKIEKDVPEPDSKVLGTTSNTDVQDSISKQELEKHILQFPIPPGHTQQIVILLNLSPKGFFDQYLADDAPFWLGKFYEDKGEKKVENGQWADPAEDEKVYLGNNDIQVKKLRPHFVEI